MFPIVLLWCFAGMCLACLDNQDAAFKATGIACRITKPAALVLNEQTTNVIQAAFQHARYPDMKGEKYILFIGKVYYGLNNLEIHNLSIGKSEVELRQDNDVLIDIASISVTFNGTLKYGYGNWLFDMGSFVDFELESHVDLKIPTDLYCSNDRVAADTTGCSINFHKLQLHLQGDRQPGWIKRMFTDFVMFTVKRTVGRQICREINKAADILAEFIQQRAELFLSDGDIGVDITLTASPKLTDHYIESYHKGVARAMNITVPIVDSGFCPTLLTEHRMLYFWISDQVLQGLVSFAHQGGRFSRSVVGQELKDLFHVNLDATTPQLVSQLLSSEQPLAKMWSLLPPQLWTTPQGTSVRTVAAVELKSSSSDPEPSLLFHTEVEVVVQSSYADKQLILDVKPTEIVILKTLTAGGQELDEDVDVEYLKEVVRKIGIPKVVSDLEPGLTKMMDSHGLHLFDIINPEVISQQGYVVVQLDFGFPHHLLVEFLQKTLQSSAASSTAEEN